MIVTRLLAILAAGVLVAPAAAAAAPRCATDPAATSVDMLAGLPDDVRRDLSTDGRVADLGQPYATDSRLPVRRLAQAGRTADRWYVWIETGLPGLHDTVLGFAPDGRNGWRRIAELAGEPCKAIQAVLAGLTTPSLDRGTLQTYRDPASGLLFVVGHDGRHLTAIGPDGSVRWDVDPFAKAGLDPYRGNRPFIVEIGPAPTGLKNVAPRDFISIGYDSSQFGIVRIADGDFKFLGQD